MAYFMGGLVDGLSDGLTRRIVLALGLSPLLLAGAAGCAVRSLDDPDDVGDGSGDEEGDGDADGDADGGDATATSGGSGDGEGSSSITVGSEDDGTVPPMQTCWPSDEWLEWELWLPVGSDGQCACDEQCQMLAFSQWDQENCCSSCWYSFGSVLCAEQLGEQCHYVTIMQEEGCGKGRPLMVDDCARVAEPRARQDWACADRIPKVDGLTDAQRRALAEVWTDAALAEHASVASFARFVLDLTAMGAPPALLADATAAMQDEIRHAQVAFGLAQAYAGHPVGPGPLAMDGVTAGGPAEAIVRAAVREGCVEETLAAAEAQLAAQRATEPAVRAALMAIAEDEARHAELAWRFVDWAVRQDRSLAAAVEDEVSRALAAPVEPEQGADVGLPEELASAHGVVPRDVRQRLRARCLEGTVRVCAAAMLGRVERSVGVPGARG